MPCQCRVGALKPDQHKAQASLWQGKWRRMVKCHTLPQCKNQVKSGMYMVQMEFGGWGDVLFVRGSVGESFQALGGGC